MKYISTRGQAPHLDFGDVLLAGLAADGGLYVPDQWPDLSPEALSGSPGRGDYADLASEVMWPFVDGAYPRSRFDEMVRNAYAGFDDPDVVPMVELGDGMWLMELFHGPTLAFKDIALQLVGHLFDERAGPAGRAGDHRWGHFGRYRIGGHRGGAR